MANTYTKGGSTDTWIFPGAVSISGETVNGAGAFTDTVSILIANDIAKAMWIGSNGKTYTQGIQLGVAGSTLTVGLGFGTLGTATTGISVNPDACTTGISIGLTGKTYTTGIILGATGSTITTGITMPGTYTTGINVNANALTTGISVGLTGKTYTTGIQSGVTGGTVGSAFAVDGTATTVLTLTGTITSLIDLTPLTAANASVYSTSGTAATTWAGRIKIIDAAGVAAWINVYSTSNEA